MSPFLYIFHRALGQIIKRLYFMEEAAKLDGSLSHREKFEAFYKSIEDIIDREGVESLVHIDMNRDEICDFSEEIEYMH